MGTPDTLLFELALTAYFTATILGIVDLFKGIRESSRLLLCVAITGFVIHTASIVYRYAAGGQLPLASMHEASSFFSWCIVAIYLVLQKRYRIGILSSFVMPVVFVMMLSASVLPREIKPLSPVLQSYWLGIHTTVAFLGNAAFAVAFGTGIMYLLQEYCLKRKRFGRLFQRLPSLQVLDEINYRLVTVGFSLLTLAIITGALWAESAWGGYWRWDPKEVWSLITWLIYALVLHIRFIAGIRGRKSAVLIVIGFLAVLFTFFGVDFLFTSVHSF